MKTPVFTLRRLLIVALLLVSGWALYLHRPAPALTAPQVEVVELRDLTWVEVREAIKSGKTSVIIPTAGIEQNGPHAVLGKHGYIVAYTAREIARALGDTLVAPVIETVPEGPVDPPEGHMAFPGTLSLPEAVFEALLEYTARSLNAHGFTAIYLLGDSGGNQAAQARVAEKLNKEWADSGVGVYHLDDYYLENGQIAWLRAQGYSDAEIGSHAGIRDTSELLAVHAQGVRQDRLAPNGGRFNEATGVIGDPTLASVEIGKKMLALKIQAALRQIRKLRGEAPPPETPTQ